MFDFTQRAIYSFYVSKEIELKNMEEDTPLGEDRRKLILGFVDAVRTYILNSHADKKFIEELDGIQRRIEGVNVIETYFKDWGIKEHHETGEVFQRARADVKLNFKKRDINNKHRFQVSAIPLAIGIFSSYLYSIQQAKIDVSDLPHIIAYVSIGLLIVIVFYISYTLSIYLFGISISSKTNWNFIWQTIPVLFLAVLINTLFYLFIVFNAVNIYSQLSPYFLKLIQGVIKMDVGSLFVTGSVILTYLTAIFASWDFVRKRLRKQRDEIKKEEELE